MVKGMGMRNFSAEIRTAISVACSAREAADAARAADPPRPAWQARAEANAATEAECALRREAAEAFAALNGWRVSKSFFGTRTLARGGVHSSSGYLGGYDPLEPRGEAFDHPVHFRERARPYRAAAIVGQPYSHASVNGARLIAAHLGLHAPPNVAASWHNPGSTSFFVFTRPGTAVRFLPEQNGGAG